MAIHYVAWRLSREARHALAAASLGLLISACSDAGHRLGGVTEKAQSESGAQNLTPCALGEPLEPIDYMEDNDGTIDFTAGRAGVWFAFNDHSGQQFPDPYAERFKMTELEPRRQNSRYAARTSGSGFGGWGAGIGFELRAQQPYDASSYAGISFWARRGSEPATPNVQLAIPDSATAPAGGECDEAKELCHDDFGSDLVLGQEFQYFSFTWEQMVARDWSERSAPSINASKVYGIRFQVENGLDFDFSIDDLSFLCRND